MTDALIQIPRVLGPVRGAIVHICTRADIQIPRVLGTVRGRGQGPRQRASIRVPRVLGTVRASGGRTIQAQGRIARVLGRVRGRGISGDNPWLRYGLPLPSQEGYSYQPSEKLIRTPMASGYTRQRRRWTDGFRQASVSFEMPLTQLGLFEALLDEVGPNWFKMPLVTGDNPSRVAVDHRVRVMGDHSVSEVDWNWVKVMVPIELPVTQPPCRSLLVTTNLFPIEVTESSGTEAGAPFVGELYKIAPDFTSTTAPSPFTGTLAQTVFWHYIGVTTPDEYIEPDATDTTAPAPFVGTLEQTVWWTRIDDLESTGTTAPAPFTGTLEQTVWWTRIDDMDSTSTTAPAPFTGTLA